MLAFLLPQQLQLLTFHVAVASQGIHEKDALGE